MLFANSGREQVFINERLSMEKEKPLSGGGINGTTSIIVGPMSRREIPDL
jgi:hypothetical protein